MDTFLVLSPPRRPSRLQSTVCRCRRMSQRRSRRHQSLTSSPGGPLKYVFLKKHGIQLETMLPVPAYTYTVTMSNLLLVCLIHNWKQWRHFENGKSLFLPGNPGQIQCLAVQGRRRRGNRSPGKRCRRTCWNLEGQTRHVWMINDKWTIIGKAQWRPSSSLGKKSCQKWKLECPSPGSGMQLETSGSASPETISQSSDSKSSS